MSARVVALVLVPLLGIGFAVAVLHRPGEARVTTGERPVSVRGTLSPRDPQFGDSVVATIDVAVDGSRVDADTLRVTTAWAPYRIASTRRTVRGSVTHLEQRLRCLELACASLRDGRTFRFAPVRVSYRDGPRKVTVAQAWPALRVHSRASVDDLTGPVVRVTPPQAAVSGYRLPQRATGWALLGLAALLAIAGGAVLLRVGLRGVSRRRRAPASPVEQILAELTSANGDVGRRRRALEELARRLEPVDGLLSRESRVLAWAPQDPQADAIGDLASRVRGAVRA